MEGNSCCLSHNISQKFLLDEASLGVWVSLFVGVCVCVCGL